MRRRKVKIWKFFIPIYGAFYALSLLIDFLRGVDLGLGDDDEKS